MSAVVVQVPGLFPGLPLCWRVGVGDSWGSPGEILAAPPGPALITLELEAMTSGLWLRATTRFQVDVAPAGTTVIALRVGPRAQAFTAGG